MGSIERAGLALGVIALIGISHLSGYKLGLSTQTKQLSESASTFRTESGLPVVTQDTLIQARISGDIPDYTTTANWDNRLESTFNRLEIENPVVRNYIMHQGGNFLKTMYEQSSSMNFDDILWGSRNGMIGLYYLLEKESVKAQE